jgi:hypothetical protein
MTDVRCTAMGPRAHHVCPVGTGGGGFIEEHWCFDQMAPILSRMSPITSEADVLVPELVLAQDGPLTIRYAPFDRVNVAARVVIVGITPGRHQMYLACQEAQRALVEGEVGDEVLRRAKAVAAFAGPMRTNLISMLDGIGLHQQLGLETSGALFGGHSKLLHSTSAILYPAFFNGKNYSGTPPPDHFPLLSAFVDQVLIAELAMLPEAVVVPLGNAVSELLRREVERGTLRAERCLYGFPHPSGANGHRKRLYDRHFEDLATKVAAWEQ